MGQHLVAIFGGAVAGAEAAFQLAERGIRSVVFEQHLLPYGKIEDGLPRWHAKLREKEESLIDEKLSHPNVYFVPNTRLGRDLNFRDVAQWGFSALLLATGAWKDRPLPVPGIDQFIGKGLVYQNPFIYWFNHHEEAGYRGPEITLADNALVIGGGLASIDVAKAIMILTVRQALAEKGLDYDLFTLERSIAAVLNQHRLSLHDLGLKGCTLAYRRRIKDMPLYSGPLESSEKIEQVRAKILEHARSKYLFNILPLHTPIGWTESEGRLSGIILRKTRLKGNRLDTLPGSELTFTTRLVISSIGSIPEPIEGIPWKGSGFDVVDEYCCRLNGFKNVFAIGNAVTGRGNILESLKHGRSVSQSMAAHYLQDPDRTLSNFLREKEVTVNHNVDQVIGDITLLNPPSIDQLVAILDRVKLLQERVGYDGNYHNWIRDHKPARRAGI